MAAVTISPKYQVVIPKEIREKLQFRLSRNQTARVSLPDLMQV